MSLDFLQPTDTLPDSRLKINANDDFLEGLVLDYLLEHSFSSSSSETISHGLGTKNLVVRVLENDSELVIPESVTFPDDNTIQVDFAVAISGTIYVTR